MCETGWCWARGNVVVEVTSAVEVERTLWGDVCFVAIRSFVGWSLVW